MVVCFPKEMWTPYLNESVLLHLICTLMRESLSRLYMATLLRARCVLASKVVSDGTVKNSLALKNKKKQHECCPHNQPVSRWQ